MIRKYITLYHILDYKKCKCLITKKYKDILYIYNMYWIISLIIFNYNKLNNNKY